MGSIGVGSIISVIIVILVILLIVGVITKIIHFFRKGSKKQDAILRELKTKK